jgi:hypothetical protein
VAPFSLDLTSLRRHYDVVDLIRYVEELRQQVMAAAEAGGEPAIAVAERLMAPLESSVRLVLLDALSAAADEITGELAPGSVEVRLRGREPEFVVIPAPAEGPDGEALATRGPAGPPPPTAPPPDVDEAATTRVTLRLPEHLKVRIEAAAGRDGLSVNAWLVRAVAESLGPPARTDQAPRGTATGGQRFTGWAR